MARAHFTKQIIRKVSGAPADGSVQVYLAGTSTVLNQTIYSADSGVATRANPFDFTAGVIDFFLDKPARIKLVITPTGGTAQTFDHLDVDAPAEVRSAYARHYLTRSA